MVRKINNKLYVHQTGEIYYYGLYTDRHILYCLSVIGTRHCSCTVTKSRCKGLYFINSDYVHKIKLINIQREIDEDSYIIVNKTNKKLDNPFVINGASKIEKHYNNEKPYMEMMVEDGIISYDEYNKFPQNINMLWFNYF